MLVNNARKLSMFANQMSNKCMKDLMFNFAFSLIN